jgi:hypothetical protein
MSGVAALKELVISKTVRLQHFTWQRSVLMGAGLAYAWSNNKAWHTPLIVLMPSAYTGYHGFKWARDEYNKDEQKSVIKLL